MSSFFGCSNGKRGSRGWVGARPSGLTRTRAGRAGWCCLCRSGQDRNGRHVNEPTELDDAEASGYWAEVLTAARALISVYRPLKMNYETLGNSLPHLHTHMVPRFTDDPRPGQPFPLSAQQPDAKVPEAQLWADANALRKLLDYEL